MNGFSELTPLQNKSSGINLFLILNLNLKSNNK